MSLISFTISDNITKKEIAQYESFPDSLENDYFELKLKGSELLNQTSSLTDSSKKYQKEIGNYVLYYRYGKNNSFFQLITNQVHKDPKLDTIFFSLIDEADKEDIRSQVDANDNLTPNGNSTFKSMILKYQDMLPDKPISGRSETLESIKRQSSSDPIELKDIIKEEVVDIKTSSKPADNISLSHTSLYGDNAKTTQKYFRIARGIVWILSATITILSTIFILSRFCASICCLCCIKPPRVSNLPENEDPLMNNAQEKSVDQQGDILINANKRDEIIETYPNDDPSYSEPCFPDKWIRDEEKGIIPNTKRQIINQFNREFNNNEGFEELHNKDNMQLAIKYKSNVKDGIGMIKMDYFIPKREFPSAVTLEDLAMYMSSPAKRKIWDDQMKDYLLVEGTDISLGIVYIWMKKPVLLISERDMVEKIVSFRGNDNVFYSLSSSVNDEYAALKDEVTRVVDWYSSYTITEDNNNFYFKTLNQVDFKMITPSFILKITLPLKLKTWYATMKARMSLDFPATTEKNIVNEKEPEKDQENNKQSDEDNEINTDININKNEDVAKDLLD